MIKQRLELAVLFLFQVEQNCTTIMLSTLRCNNDNRDLVKYLCPKCNKILRDAVQTSCGHWLCHSCAEEIFIQYVVKSKQKVILP